jgi:hypothetical protein
LESFLAALTGRTINAPHQLRKIWRAVSPLSNKKRRISGQSMPDDGRYSPRQGHHRFQRSLPEEQKTLHNYLQYVPGIVFTLSVGNEIKPKDKVACFLSNSLHPILVKDFSKELLAHVNHNTRNAVATQEVKNLYQKHRSA